MSFKYQVIVIGGGVVGLSAALAMAQRHLSVALIDVSDLKTTTKKTELRVYAINKASEVLFRQIGAWEHLSPKKMNAYRHMHVWDELSGACIDFDARDVAAANLGYIIDDTSLKNALLTAINQCPQIELYANQHVIQVEEREQTVHITSATHSWNTPLLMIADGANSFARKQLQVEMVEWSYQQQALTATVRTEKPHQHTAYQVFRPDGPLAFLPLGDMHRCSIVWSLDTTQAEKMMTCPEDEFNDALCNAFSATLGTVVLEGPRHGFNLHMRHVKQYVGAQWLILGDAAHSIHPLAGLGLNLGLADLQALINYLDAPLATISSKTLHQYQRDRKYHVWQTIALMEGFKRIFGTSSTPLVSLRGMGLTLCDHLEPLKRLCIRHAVGV